MLAHLTGGENVQHANIVIIGAGMAGLACARRLHDAGLAVTVVEKSGTIGGRLATKLVSRGRQFDHGAQFVTAHGADFQAYLQNAVTSGHAAPWMPNRPTTGNDPWVTGIPGMNSLVAPLADGLSVLTRQHVARVSQDADGITLYDHAGTAVAHGDILVSTLPAPQAAALLDRDGTLSDQLADVRMAPCWALMLGFNRRLPSDLDVLQPDQAVISFAARNNSKIPGADLKENWTIHTTPAWSADTMDRDKELVARDIRGYFRHLFEGPLPPEKYSFLHRWRYARTLTPLGAPFIRQWDGRLFVGGDWCLGARVEFAWQSGLAMAEAVLA